MRVISCRPPSHPSLPEAEGVEGVKGGSGRGKGQGHTGGRAGSEVKLGYPQALQQKTHLIQFIRFPLFIHLFLPRPPRLGTAQPSVHRRAAAARATAHYSPTSALNNRPHSA